MENPNKETDQLASIRRLKSLKLDESEKNADPKTEKTGRTWVLVVVVIAMAVGGYIIGRSGSGDGDLNPASENANNPGAGPDAAAVDPQITEDGGPAAGGTIIANGYVVAGDLRRDRR